MENAIIRAGANMDAFAEGMRKMGEAARQAAEVIANIFAPAVKNCLDTMLRFMRTQTGAWYSRYYWRAAYATADRFPSWVSAD